MSSSNGNHGYAHPAALVETAWVADHLDTPGLRLVEVDVDTAAYATGHLPGAVAWDWRRDTQQPIRRDLPEPAALEDLLSRSGITPETTIIFYGDNHNWFATFAYWLMTLYRHADARIMNGGRAKWIAEGRPLTTEVPRLTPTGYRLPWPDLSPRATRDQVLGGVGQPGSRLVDVRSPQEYSGALLAPEHLPQEGAQRGGHIPGAANIPWSQAVGPDGTFKSAAELRALYTERGITPDQAVVTYCRIGERSSHTWFVLKHLLGYPRVRNYDGSWTEWGSLIGVPIER